MDEDRVRIECSRENRSPVLPGLPGPQNGHCEGCGQVIPPSRRGKPKKWHSDACRKRHARSTALSFQLANLEGRPSSEIFQELSRRSPAPVVRSDQYYERRLAGWM